MSQVETPPKPAVPEIQMLEAALGPLKAHRTRHGTMIAPGQDTYVGRSLEVYGEYAPAETNALVSLIKPGMSIVEAGSNVGAHTLALARACAPGPVYAFEPQQRLLQILCANLILNGVRNVIVSGDALGAEPGAARVPPLDYAKRNNFAAIALQTAETLDGPYSVQVRTIDSLGLKACHLIKADVESWECEVIRGATQTIARFRPLLYVDNEKEKHQKALVRLIDGMGYDLFWHAPLLYHPKNFNGVAEDVFPGVASANMFCSPKEKGLNIKGLTKIDPDNIRPPLRIAERNKGPLQP